MTFTPRMLLFWTLSLVPGQLGGMRPTLELEIIRRIINES